MANRLVRNMAIPCAWSFRIYMPGSLWSGCAAWSFSLTMLPASGSKTDITCTATRFESRGLGEARDCRIYEFSDCRIFFIAEVQNSRCPQWWWKEWIRVGVWIRKFNNPSIRQSLNSLLLQYRIVPIAHQLALHHFRLFDVGIGANLDVNQFVGRSIGCGKGWVLFLLQCID